MATIDEVFGDDDSPVAEVVEAIDPTAASQDADSASVAAGSEDSADNTPAVTESAEEEVVEETPATAPAVQAKKVTFKVGDQDVPLDEDAKFQWKVDGKREDITLKDLITNYAGKIPVERRFAELDKVRKEDAQRIQQFENTKARQSHLIHDMHSRVQKGDMFGAVASMLEMSGSKADPRQFINELRTGMIEQAQKLASMSEAERAVLDEREQREYLQARYDRLLQQQDQEKAQAAQRDRVSAAMQSVNATLEDYASNKAQLEQAYRERNWNVADVTPEKVASHIKDLRDYGAVREAMIEVDPELVNNDKLWEHGVYLLRQNSDWTKEDLRDVFAEAAAQKRGKSVGQKVAKAPVATVAAAVAKAKTAPVSEKQKQKQLLLQQKPESYGSFDESDLNW